MSTDRFESEFPWQSPYLYASNNPISFIDINGDSTWVETNTVTNPSGETQTDYTVFITGKMLNLSSGNTADVAKGVSEYYNSKSTFWRDSNGSLFTIKFNAQFSVASSMGDVSEDSHLLVIVDDVLGEADPELGEDQQEVSLDLGELDILSILQVQKG